MDALLHAPLPRFIVQAGLIIVVARLVGIGTRALRQPMVIAEIVAGIALGPSLFGWLFPEATGLIFPSSSMPLLGLLSQVGLILFMFLVGLEFDPQLLRDRGRASVAISHSSIVVPFALGTLLALYLYPRVSSPSVPFWSFTLFMGVAMSITAFPVLARILVERRLLRTKVGAVTIACAAVDDVTAWCILAFVVSVARSGGVFEAVRTTLLALGYIALVFVVLRPFLRRLGARRFTSASPTQDVVALTLLVLLGSSLITELIGIHALFGAFLAGVIVPKNNGFAQGLANKLEDLVVVFLLPLFFAYSGLRTEIGLLSSGDAWLLCALIIVVACVGKFGGSALAARWTGLSWREASALGILMNTRGLMELVVLNIGLDLGVISPTLFTMMVLMALVTTFMTSPLLDWVHPELELERGLVGAAAGPASGEGSFTVLACVAYEGSAEAMLTVASALGGASSERRRIYALHLVPPADRASFVLSQHAGEASGHPLAPLLARAAALDVDVQPLSFVSPDPGADICNVASAKSADFVLLAWHPPLLRNQVLRGTVREVMRKANTDVGVLVDRGLRSVRRVLVPFLGSTHDRMALRLAHRVLQRTQAEVTILHVVAPSVQRSRLGAAEVHREVFKEQAGERPTDVTFQVVEHTSPAEAVAEESARGYDLVIIGVGSEWGLEQRLFGVQSELIVQRCPTSLLVVRERGLEASAPVSHPLSSPPRFDTATDA